MGLVEGDTGSSDYGLFVAAVQGSSGLMGFKGFGGCWGSGLHRVVRV